jgi:hypothetical protein
MMHPSVFGIASNTSEALLNESQTFEVYITKYAFGRNVHPTIDWSILSKYCPRLLNSPSLSMPSLRGSHNLSEVHHNFLRYIRAHAGHHLPNNTLD